MSLFDPTEKYREEFIDALKANKQYHPSEISTYKTPRGNEIKYYKWKHPYQGEWEYVEIFTDEILSFFKNNLTKESVAIDIGAQAGLMSVLYAQFAGKVISFEPNPAAFEPLELNSRIYNNIIPYNLACSFTEDILQFHYSDEGFCNGGFATNCILGIGVTGHVVPMDVYSINITDFLNTYHKNDIQNIKLIKIDAEGHDKDILTTLIPLIKEHNIKPIIITEMYGGLMEQEVISLINTIYSLDYSIFNITKDNSGLGIESRRQKINSIDDVKIGTLCNFLCLPNQI